MAGYSKTPLAKKLGIEAGARVALVDPPDGFGGVLEPLPPEVTIRSRARGPLDIIVFFTDRASRLRRRFPTLARNLDPAGGLWIGWPKKASGVTTDLSFDVVQGVGLDAGMVDNKICAIDDTYSGLRFVVRVEDRAQWPRRLGKEISD